MTETELATSVPHAWDSVLQTLDLRFPGQRPSVLFCIWKLQQNPDLTLRDFRDEAALYGIPVAGRALHSAKVLLGLVAPERKPKPEAESALRPAVPKVAKAPRDDSDGSIETKLMAAVRQLQSAADADTTRLRNAIRQAIAVLEDALD